MVDLHKVREYTKELKVLYVEDDKGLLKETEELLLNFFKDIVTATNGEIGLELYKNGEFDLVITDIKMPKMDGIELSEKIMEINSEQAIIITSAYNDSDKLLSLIKIGISDFLLKPINLEQLLKVLYKVSKNIYTHKKEKEFLFSQSKLAIMGEMVDITAHQWLQFINVLSLKIDLLSYENENGTLNRDKIAKFINEANFEIEELVEILEEFRGFFRNKRKQKVIVKDIIKNVLVLLKDYLVKHSVNVETDVDETIIKIYPNEFKQVIMNIIINMVEAFEERNIETRNINFSLFNSIDGVVLEICDNAGGIEEDLIDSIFESNFTTKKGGTGMGLYLSKTIMERLGGDISVMNKGYGVKFSLKFKG
jgi:YesN/AraC family two-component response regulator